MRILIIITRGELGGAQTHVLELCRAMRKKIDFLVLIGGKERSMLEDRLCEMSVDVCRVDSLSNSLSPGRILAGIVSIRKKIYEWRPDIVHVHSAVASVVGRLAGWIAEVPVVYTVHGFGFKPEVPLLQRSAAFVAEQLLAPLAARVICVSRFEFDLAKRLLVKDRRLAVISNGISDTLFCANPGAEPLTFIMVARMDAPKRQDIFTKAIVILRERGVTLPRVILAGGGPLLEDVREFCARHDLNNIETPGDLDTISERLAASQVFVLLSDHEGQPISIIEAMRAGLPIIASNLPGIRGQVTHGVEGLLTSNSVEDVADRMEELIGSAEKRICMGRAARRRYESEFGSEIMALKVVEVYSDVIGRSQVA
ncbi:glycosyltransferase family 4 protein [Variovorax sp. J22R115]|uniref:glycosyltransferase family 4 protein n=1 Tax=Variovorax sp. J22R115 TaxID=3053509 RepID=UPI002575E85E|nr:glycosyltransferase family 4 protein [Variovorax sp. J22R115]MDM0053470.1 glycosyltransferase family 4 protein [Variovorax sp. J22R115]